ncbi:hypothetical protein F5887DRAFT_618439 [Amanita rubescens]|nr:hypothetical protein F5887DRAFT_618439 [Amanita rubescens]
MASHGNDYDPISSSPPISGTPPFLPSTQEPRTSMHQLSLSEFLAQSFPPFDHRTILDPFAEEAERDAAFQEELVDMLLDALIETHAWANARLKFENEIAAERFEQKISGTMIMEKEQGMSSSLLERTRERLLAFVHNIKNAIMALTAAIL